jgi:hypothetical protein
MKTGLDPSRIFMQWGAYIRGESELDRCPIGPTSTDAFLGEGICHAPCRAPDAEHVMHVPALQIAVDDAGPGIVSHDGTTAIVRALINRGVVGPAGTAADNGLAAHGAADLDGLVRKILRPDLLVRRCKRAMVSTANCGFMVAQPIEPRPPASATAAASSTVPNPAIGASTIGCSISNSSTRRRSGHILALPTRGRRTSRRRHEGSRR